MKNADLRLISVDVAWEVQALRRTLCRSRIVDVLDSNPSLLAWALTSQSVQCCPHCAAFVQKAEGCRHITCKCGGEFCYICGEPYASCAQGQSCLAHGAAPKLRVDLEGLISLRSKRRLAVCMGMHCRVGADSAVQRLPPDLVRRISLMAVPPLPVALMVA